MAARDGRQLSRVESDTYARFPRLADRRSQLAGTLSGGEQQMLALARGLATDPALLVLDELSMGLAPIIVEELYAEVTAIAASGVSILVVEQFARTVLGVADRAAILSGGRIAATGEPAAIEAELVDHYLGAAKPISPT
jgi:branched-chain amino acid transport system ATP-binding protein